MALLVIDKGAETVLRYIKPKCLLHRPDAASPSLGSVTNERIRKKHTFVRRSLLYRLQR